MTYVRTKIWAHRGRLIPNLYGNTLLDFQEAYELGIHGIETDVCFTAPDEDGSQQPIIHHPDTKNPDDPSNIKWSHLKFIPKIKVLRLDNFLAFLKVHSNLFCCLEPKEDSEKLLDVIVQKITEYGLENRIYLTACQLRVPYLELEASAKLLSKARSQNPKIKTHLIATFPFSLPALAHKYNPDIISVGWLPESKFSKWFFKTFLMNIVNLKQQIKQVQNMGVEIIGGIVNEEKDFEYFVGLGVDGIMTDDSIAAMKFIKTKSPQAPENKNL